MIDIQEIEKEIEMLENKDYINYSICEKLAMMYIIRDHYQPREPMMRMSAAVPPGMMGNDPMPSLGIK